MNRETTQLARSPLLLLDYAQRLGLDRRELVAGAGLTEAQLADPDTRIPTAAMRRLWGEVLRQNPDPALGLQVASSITADQLGLVGYTMVYSATLGEALNRFTRYSRIVSEAVQWVISTDPAGANIVARIPPTLVALRHPVEAGLALIVSIAREITGCRLTPVSINLPTRAPDSLTIYQRHFGCPLNFEWPDAGIRFTRQQMRLPTGTPDSALVGYLDDLATMRLDELQDEVDDVVQQVRQALWSMLPGGRPDLWRIASRLGTSPRTLQRRLSERGTSFSRVLDELRRELSDELLGDRKLAVTEVSFLLGYSEPSAFQRAARRWRGVSPRRSRPG